MKRLSLILATILIAGVCLSACEPEIVEKEVVVTQLVVETVMEEVIVEGTPQIVEKEVTKVVEVEVEKVVTATPEPINKVITFAWTQEPDSMNWIYSNMWFSSILQQLFHCWAWEFDDQNSAFPRLVTEIPSMENGGVTEDGLVITMQSAR